MAHLSKCLLFQIKYQLSIKKLNQMRIKIIFGKNFFIGYTPSEQENSCSVTLDLLSLLTGALIHSCIALYNWTGIVSILSLTIIADSVNQSVHPINQSIT